MGLDPALAYSDLHAGEVADGPRTVRASKPGRPGEAIPDLEKASGPKLDATRIAAIRSDTERVSSVLGQIFDVEEEESGASTPDYQSQVAGLDPDMAANSAQAPRLETTSPPGTRANQRSSAS